MEIRKTIQRLSVNKLPVAMILLVGTLFTVFLDEELMINKLLVGSMLVSPVLLLKYTTPAKGELRIWMFLLLFLMIVIVFHLSSFRWTTIAFSCAFIIYFLIYTRVVNAQKPRIETMALALKTLLLLYTIVLIIQQFCVITGLPIFNKCAYVPSEPFKLNSLMFEPSHTARVVPIIMYVYISLREIILGRVTLRKSFQKDRLAWVAFLYCVITMLSSTAYLFMMFVFAKFLDKKRFIQFILFASGVFIVINLFGTNKYLQRTIDSSLATITLDEGKIFDADPSAAQRILPSIIGFKSVSLSSEKDFFGHGIDADGRELRIPEGNFQSSGGAFSLWYNLGFIVQIAYWIMTFSLCYIKKNKVSIVFWVFCIWIYGGMNNQIIWLTMCLLYTLKYYSMRSNNCKQKV